MYSLINFAAQFVKPYEKTAFSSAMANEALSSIHLRMSYLASSSYTEEGSFLKCKYCTKEKGEKVSCQRELYHCDLDIFLKFNSSTTNNATEFSLGFESLCFFFHLEFSDCFLSSIHTMVMEDGSQLVKLIKRHLSICCLNPGKIFATNFVESFLCLFAGHRRVLSSVTAWFGFESDEDAEATTWFYMFIFPLEMNLGSGALIAYCTRLRLDSANISQSLT